MCIGFLDRVLFLLLSLSLFLSNCDSVVGVVNESREDDALEDSRAEQERRARQLLLVQVDVLVLRSCTRSKKGIKDSGQRREGDGRTDGRTDEGVQERDRERETKRIINRK